MNSLSKSVSYLSVLFLSLLLFASCTEGVSDVTVIRGATLIDGTGADPVENSLVVVQDDRILCAGAADECSIPLGAEVVEARGKYLTPGIVDAHMHFFQTGFFDGRPDAMDLNETYPFSETVAYQRQNPQRYYDSYLCSGVTAVYDVGGMSWSVDLQDQAEANPRAPHVAAAGPLITPVQGIAFDLPSDKVLVPLNSVEDGIKTVQYLSDLGSTGIKFWIMRPDDEEYMARVEATAEEIRKKGNQMIAHATTLSQAKAALRNGTKLLVHSVGDQSVDEEFIELAKANGTYYNPTLVVSTGYLLAYRAAAGIETVPYPDPNGCVDAKTRELLETADQFKDHPRLNEQMVMRLRQFDPVNDRVSQIQAQNLVLLHEAGIPIVVGTDAGNPGTLHGVSIYQELEAMQAAGISPADLMVMATKNGAEIMRRGDDFGTVETGKIADLLLLDADPLEDIANMRSLTHVMIKGSLEEVEAYRPE